mmetsp:Transcript_14931/g.22466  ORF Transcript_14931/g.22466 Transcript_14931/m.22466 type:complete len:201 (+) Transcript_14931:583-1185(+)
MATACRLALTNVLVTYELVLPEARKLSLIIAIVLEDNVSGSTRDKSMEMSLITALTCDDERTSIRYAPPPPFKTLALMLTEFLVPTPSPIGNVSRKPANPFRDDRDVDDAQYNANSSADCKSSPTISYVHFKPPLIESHSSLESTVFEISSIKSTITAESKMSSTTLETAISTSTTSPNISVSILPVYHAVEPVIGLKAS